jgi:hypothetical protein
VGGFQARKAGKPVYGASSSYDKALHPPGALPCVRIAAAEDGV